MPDRYVRLNVFSRGTDSTKRELDSIREKADEVERPRNVKIGVDDADGQAKLKDLKLKLDILGRKVETAKVGVDDSAGKAKLIDVQLRLSRLSKYLASPKVTLDGADRTEARLLTIDALLDKVGGNRTARIKIDVDQNKSGGLFSRIGSLFSGAGSGGGGGGGLLSSLGIGGLIGGGLLAAGSIPGLVGLGIGGGTGLAAIMGGSLGASQGNKILKADTSNINQITTALKTAIGKQKTQLSAALQAANKQYAKDSAFYAPFLAFQKSLKDLAQNFLAPLRPIMAPLAVIIASFGKGLTALGPQLTAMFKASLPFIKTFASLMLTSGKTLLPAFTSAMTTMVKSGALKEMTQGLVYLIQGLAGFIVALGPGMKASGQIFERIMLAVKVALIVLGKVVSWIANAIEFNFPAAFKHAWRVIKSDADTFRQWIWNDFGLKIVNFFTKTIPIGLDIFRDKARIIWDKVEIDVLKFVYNITGFMAKLPGPLGAPFKKAHTAIGSELAKIAADVARTVAKINGDWGQLHGKKVALTFGLNLPAGVSYPSRHIKGHAKGTPGAEAGWAWVGERGPELVRFRGGETVLSNAQSQRVTRGYASGTGFDVSDTFTPSSGTFISNLNKTFAADMAAIIRHVRATAQLSLSMFGDSGARTHSAAVAQAYAKSILGLFGWGANQFLPLVQLWNQESGWNAYAVNPSSGAAGIAQSLGHGPVTLGDYVSQINWGLGYIRQRYGSPAAAEGHEQAFNWYGRGGWIKEPIIGRGLRTGQGYAFGELGPEYVSPDRHMPGGNVTHYTVNVHATPLAHPADIGREVVTAIRQFEKRSGKGWRSGQ